jgi:hypothetical protein
LSSSLRLWMAAFAGASAVPCRGLTAQALDSTGMPSLELLAREAGRASRRHPIHAVAPALLCEATHPLVDSASLAACAILSGPRGEAISAAFARGLEVPVAGTTDPNAPIDLPVCPADLERVAEPRVLVARITAPVAGVREGVWEGRLTVELRCRSPATESGGGIRTMGKAYLYQWSGREWKLYQHSWWRAER